jgi:hypothetical protein
MALRVLLRETLAGPHACLLPELADVVFGYMPFVLPVPVSGEPIAGLVHWLGTRRGSAPWSNPALPPSMSVCVSSKDGRNADSVARRIDAQPHELRVCNYDWFQSYDVEDSFVEFDFGYVQIQPTAYTIQHCVGFRAAVCSWQLEGSLDRVDWTVLHVGVSSNTSDVTRESTRNSAAGRSHETWSETWLVTPHVFARSPRKEGCDSASLSSGIDVYYRYIRLHQTGVNSAGTNHLRFRALELYGAAIDH